MFTESGRRLLGALLFAFFIIGFSVGALLDARVSGAALTVLFMIIFGILVPGMLLLGMWLGRKVYARWSIHTLRPIGGGDPGRSWAHGVPPGAMRPVGGGARCSDGFGNDGRGGAAAGPPPGAGVTATSIAGGYGPSTPLPTLTVDPIVLSPVPAPLERESGSEPAWYEDPTGRHQFRYHDGANWTDHVSDEGDVSADPV